MAIEAGDFKTGLTVMVDGDPWVVLEFMHVKPGKGAAIVKAKMKNLRSFKYNKISIIGLVFLLFFGLGVFCVMSNTTANINNEYTSLAETGKLHDFTVSELYEIGSEEYSSHSKGYSFIYQDATISNFQAYLDLKDQADITMDDVFGAGMDNIESSSKPYYFILPDQKIVGDTTEGLAIWTYHICLDADHSSGLYKHFAQLNPDSRLVNFTFSSTITWNSEKPMPSYIQPLQGILDTLDAGSNLNNDQIDFLENQNLFSLDYNNYLKFISQQTDSIYSTMTTTDTPLALELNKTYKNELDSRFFKSVNVTATKDNIFYKIIDSNIDDNIDKLVLFEDPNKRTGNNLFSSDDCAPYNSQIQIYVDEQCQKTYEPGTKVEDESKGISIVIPSDFNDVASMPLYNLDSFKQWNNQVKYVYSQIIQIRFKRMLSGDVSAISDPETFNINMKRLAGINLNPVEYLSNLNQDDSDLQKSYSWYFNEWYLANNETITISPNGNVVYGWVEITGTPQTCTISNWTTRLAIVNPQHLQANNKRVLDPSVLNDFIPFNEWYKATYHQDPTGEISNSVAKNWFNSLTQDQFTFWIDPYKLTKLEGQGMSYDIPGRDEPIVIQIGTEPGQWNGIEKKYIAPCGGYDEIIWGCGLTPDFMYPIVDISRPTPNPSNECLVYCNTVGYYSIKLAFVNSTVEEYIIGKFKSNVSSSRRQQIIEEINKWGRENMIFPDTVKCAYFANDTSNVLNSSGFRIAYIPNLVNVIQIVSIILCSFIGLLCLVICFVIIKRYVERNRINIGIMRANGIKKWKIGFSLLPFALLPAVVGGVGAYFAGLGLQPLALSLFKNYWMLPTPLINFEPISFILAIFIPFIVFAAICFFATLIVLRIKTTDLMKAGSEFKTSSFSRFVKKPFRRFGVVTRFRISLAFNSISRLIMMAGMSCLTMSSLVFAMTTFDKLNKSRITKWI